MRRKLGQINFHKDFQYHYWGHTGQLLANFFPCPQYYCPRNLKWQINKRKDKFPGLTTVSSICFISTLMGKRKTTEKDVFSVSDTGSWDCFFISRSHRQSHFQLSYKMVNNQYAIQVTFLINFTGQVKLFLSHKGKSQSPEATRKCQSTALLDDFLPTNFLVHANTMMSSASFNKWPDKQQKNSN